MMSLDPKFWWYVIGLEASGDNLGRHLLQETLPDCFTKFLCVTSLSTSKNL